ALTPDRYINRELSWLEFNRRVLEEAQESDSPLLVRTKFAAIFASNLDEFFMIRVAGVKRKVMAGIGEPGTDGRSPIQVLREIQRVSQDQLAAQGRLVSQGLIPELRESGVVIESFGDLSRQEK